MKEATIEIRQYNISRRAGDRATYDSTCYDFKVYVNDKFVEGFSQYDYFYCHISDYETTLIDVRAMADALADALGVKRAGPPITYIEKKVEKIEWVPVS